MSILLSKDAPPGGTAVASFASTSPVSTEALAAPPLDLAWLDGLEAPSREVSRPFRVFRATLDVAAKDVIAGARFVAWRYLLFDSKDRVSTSDVVTREDKLLLAASRRAPHLAEVVAELDWLSGQAEIDQDDYELNYLEVRGLLVEAWWLRPAAIEKSLVLPVPPTGPKVRGMAHDLLTAEEFRRRVAEDAALRLEDDVGLVSEAMRQTVDQASWKEDQSSVEDEPV